MNNREMDAFIAEKLFNNDRRSEIVGESLSQTTGATIFKLDWTPPRYTESIADAWPVFEWLYRNHPWMEFWRYRVSLTTNHGGYCVVQLREDDDDGSKLIKEWAADTFTLAICKAAVAAVEEIERAK